MSMKGEFTIQQVAKLTGLSVHTLRYYERNGLLEPVSRAANGHRRYSTEDVKAIEFLNKLRATGMSIRKMQQFAILFRQQPGSLDKRRAILESHEQEVQERIRQLNRNLEVIQWKIQHYKSLEVESESNLSNEQQYSQKEEKS